MAWLSVITVVKDDVAGFELSLDSLCSQTDSEWDLVVIDGSEDAIGTQRALESHSFTTTPTYAWREPNGVYDAMNAGLELADGDFVYFLNAGDALHSDSVLEQARSALSGDEAVWGHGPVAIVEADDRTVITPDWDYLSEKATAFSRGRFPAHQGTFVRRRALRSIGGFDLRYSVAADYAAFLALSRLADPVVLRFVVATFHEGGLSTVRWMTAFREFHAARRAILAPSGLEALRERWETARHFGLVYVHRELRPRVKHLLGATRRHVDRDGTE